MGKLCYCDVIDSLWASYVIVTLLTRCGQAVIVTLLTRCGQAVIVTLLTRCGQAVLL